MQRRGRRRERKDAARLTEVEANRGRRAREGKGARVGEGNGKGRGVDGGGEGGWQSMLLIRKARPLLWDQPSSGVHAESSRGVKRKERKRAEG